MARDYILRLIDQVAFMLAEIVSKRKAGQRAEARTEIENQALRHTGLPLRLIREAAPAAVAELLQTAGELRYIRSVLLAELLLQDAAICEETGDPAAALAAYVHVWALLHDSVSAFNAEERAHFGEKQVFAGDRIRALATTLRVNPTHLLPPTFAAGIADAPDSRPHD